MKRPSQNLSQYTKELRKPIMKFASPLEKLAIDTTGQDVRNRKRIALEQVQKMDLLLAHFGILPTSPDQWFMLAYHLAARHVPGMRIADNAQRKAGKPILDDEGLLLKLYEDVQKVMAEPHVKTLAHACRKFRATLPKGHRWKTVKPRTLENRYRRAKRLWMKSKEDEADLLREIHGEVQKAVPKAK